MSIEQISVFLENRSGRLAEAAKIMGESGVDLRAMSIADTTDFGILRVIVSDTKKALEALMNAGYAVSVTPVIAALIDNKPGGLANSLAALAEAGISVEYAYAFITCRTSDACVILRVTDNGRAAAVLGAAGTKIVSADEIFEL
ncbi:amino acid-binding protein [Synergistales bacterium]|nr:amino acid-binding protein [Synergistales bacterium]GHV56767.1 amino acid-binding protein [Synergistales bacterium]